MTPPPAGKHLMICFPSEGEATCYPEGNLADCIIAFARLIDALHENPELIPCALGVHVDPHDGAGHDN